MVFCVASTGASYRLIHNGKVDGFLRRYLHCPANRGESLVGDDREERIPADLKGKSPRCEALCNVVLGARVQNHAAHMHVCARSWFCPLVRCSVQVMKHRGSLSMDFGIYIDKFFGICIHRGLHKSQLSRNYFRVMVKHSGP